MKKKKKPMQKCSAFLAIKEMQFITTLRFQFTPVRLVVVKNTNDNKCWPGCGEMECSSTVGGKVN
jgi:hypothetical protein